MPSFTQRLRLVIALVCGVVYLATLQQGALFVQTLLLHGEHRMVVTHDDGVAQLAFLHDHSVGTDSPMGFSERFSDHQHHGDHIIELASHGDASITDDASPRLILTLVAMPLAVADMVPQRCGAPLVVLSRPPPAVRGAPLHCLRTTVLVV